MHEHVVAAVHTVSDWRQKIPLAVRVVAGIAATADITHTAATKILKDSISPQGEARL